MAEPLDETETMRIFVAIWPAAEVREALAALDRPDHPDVRWTAPDRWHVTLRFVGVVQGSSRPALRDALVAAAHDVAGPVEAVAGPATALLGRQVLMVPVAGIDALAAAVRAHAGGDPGEPFVGHLTVARGRGRRPVPSGLAGSPVAVRWPVTELCLVASVLDPAGARYEILDRVPLGEVHQRTRVRQ